MKRMCAWCGKVLGTADSKVFSNQIITHGICRRCKDHLLFQSGIELGAFLDSIKMPVVVVNREGIIVTGNVRARSLLGKGLPEIEGYRGGEVFECAYAQLPEGCGNTIHCSGCSIRKTVMETHRTGNSQLRIPATLHQNTPEDPKTIALLISTELMTDVVLLRIDKI